ncbi:MAG: Crp/Fnr family transcriptional regulator [Clostridiales Family XIII bacterium]|jgi:CRP-like cAMP-binding protein|nr:Crp/Fnr family transcriptional regulator [Clostridiales Family XIII bacterium]
MLSVVPYSIEFYHKNEVVIMQGDVQNRIGITLEGIVSTTEPGSEDSWFDNIKNEEEELLGLLAAISSKRTSPFVTTALKDSVILWFDIDDIMQSDLPPGIFRQIVRNMFAINADDNFRLIVKTKVLSEHLIRDRIMKYLSIMAEKKGSDTFPIYMTQDELAKYLCVNRTKLSTALNKLKKEGVIAYTRDSYTILNE